MNKHARKDHRKMQCKNEIFVDDNNSDSTDYLENVLISPKAVEITEESDLTERISRLIDGSAGQNVLLSMLGNTSATWRLLENLPSVRLKIIIKFLNF